MLLWLIGAAAALLSPRVSPVCFSVGPSVCGRFGCSSTISHYCSTSFSGRIQQMRASNAQKSLALRGGSPRPENALLQQKNGDFALRVLPGVVSIKTPPFAEVGSRPALRHALNASGCREKGEQSSLLSKGSKPVRGLKAAGRPLPHFTWRGLPSPRLYCRSAPKATQVS